MSRVGVVVIGRNEGERLRLCLASLTNALPIVYVDSGSTDGSPELARSFGATVVDLDLSIPFTAARARNEGFARLIEMLPELEFVQFVDGDCEVVAEWIAVATSTMDANPKAGVICGRRRERHPEASIYNRLCDIEWDTPIGEAGACGGDALMRIVAVKQVHGYDPTVIAGEDPEVCLRIRRNGWKVLRIDADMTLHDAAMTRFRQWWIRAKRCGYAFALGAHMHGRGPERHYVADRRRVIVWGILLPMAFLGLAWPTGGWSLLGFVLYPLQMVRIAFRTRHRVNFATRIAYGVSCGMAKFPEMMGVARFQWDRLRRKRARIIEYK